MACNAGQPLAESRWTLRGALCAAMVCEVGKNLVMTGTTCPEMAAAMCVLSNPGGSAVAAKT
jgi:hypothetical protein